MTDRKLRNVRNVLGISAGTLGAVYLALLAVALADGAGQQFEIPQPVSETVLMVIMLMATISCGIWLVDTSNRISREKLLADLRQLLQDNGDDGEATVRFARLDPNSRGEVVDDIRQTFREELAGPVRDIATKAINHALVVRGAAAVPSSTPTNGAPFLKIAREE